MLRAVAVRRPSDLPGASEVRQANRDLLGIEVQSLSEITDGAPRVVSEEFDDARVAIALSAAGVRASVARATRGRAPN